MRRALPMLVVLLAVFAIIWFLRPTEVDEGGAEAVTVEEHAAATPPPVVLPVDAPSPPRLEGRPDAVATPAPASTGRRHPMLPRTPRPRFYGTVRDARGTALQGVRVYQISKQGQVGSGYRRAVDATDEKGWWWFQGTSPEGTWICARRPGYRTTFLDGESASPGGELHLVLEETPALNVQLVDSLGKPFELGGVRVVPTTRKGPQSAFPGPLAPVPEQLEMTDATGSATFSFDVALPVVIIPDVEGMIALPTSQYAPTAEGSYTFEVEVAGGIEIVAVDEAGKRIRESLWVSVRDVETGQELAHYRGSERDGALEAEPPVPPGRYHLDVSARGYEPALLADFELPHGPAVVRRSVVLERLAEPATLRILLPQPSGEAKRRAIRGSGWTLLLRRTDGPWAGLGWVEHGDVQWNANAATLTVRLRPGVWEAAALDARHDIVAMVGAVTLKPDATVARRAVTVPSVSFSLYDVLPPDLAVRTARIEVPGRGFFPATGSWLSTSIRDAGGLVETIAPPESALRARAGGGALLGPYPGTHVVLEVEDWSGRSHRFTWPP